MISLKTDNSISKKLKETLIWNIENQENRPFFQRMHHRFPLMFLLSCDLPRSLALIILSHRDVRECLTGGSYLLSLMSPLTLFFKWNSTLLPETEVIVWGRLGSPLVNILFRTKLLSLAPLSWDMDCLLTLWLGLPLVPLVMVTVCLVFWSLSYKFLVLQPIYTHRKIIKAPLLHQSLGPRVFLCLSLSLFYFLIVNKWRPNRDTGIHGILGRVTQGPIEVGKY